MNIDLLEAPLTQQGCMITYCRSLVNKKPFSPKNLN